MTIHQRSDTNLGEIAMTCERRFYFVLLVALLLGRLLCFLMSQQDSTLFSNGRLRDYQSKVLRYGHNAIIGDIVHDYFFFLHDQIGGSKDDNTDVNWTPDVIFGNYSMPITFDAKNGNASEIQKAFDVALVECYGFAFFEARKTTNQILLALDESHPSNGKFRKEVDIFCPMCYWLLALGHSPYINHPMIANQFDFESASDAAVMAFEQAHNHGSRLSSKEMGLIDALSVRFSHPSSFENQTIGYVSYSNKMKELYEQTLHDTNGTGDADIMAFLADSIMVLHADSDGYNFYDDETSLPNPEIDYAITLLGKCLDVSPDHPLCQHLYIHITEPSHKMAYFSGQVADNLLAKTSGKEAQHLQHMPSHSYLRIGRYHDAVVSNIVAHDSDQHYEEHGAVAYAVAHDLVVLLCAAALSGEKSVALEYSDILRENYRNHPNRRDGPGTEIGWHVWRTIRLGFGEFKAVLEDSDWIPRGDSNTDILHQNAFDSLGNRDDDAFWPYAIVLGHYAKGVASLWNIDPSSSTENRLSEANKYLKKLREASVFVDNSLQGMVSVANWSLASSIQFYQIHTSTRKGGDDLIHYRMDGLEPVLELLQSARVEQDSWTYTEPPLWHSDIKLCEGTLLRLMGRYNEALLTFEAGLIDWPENRLALYGLWKVLKAQGASAETIRDIQDQFEKSSSWADGNVKKRPPLVCPELGE